MGRNAYTHTRTFVIEMCSAQQAGNKSLLSFRSDIGVPGYTGFCPSSAGITLPIKGFQHTGRPVTTEFKQSLTTQTVEPEKVKVSE